MSDAKTTLHLDGRSLVAKTTQDVEPILENNKRLQKEKQVRGRSFHHAAAIPTVIYNKWLNEAELPINAKWNGPEMEEIVKKRLKDPNWKYLRTDCPQQTYTHGGLHLPAKQLLLPKKKNDPKPR